MANTGGTDGTGDRGSRSGGGAASGPQPAAARVRTAASEVAERVPAAVSSAQGAVDETARALSELPTQTLMLGASFSLGLAAGMFLSGTNRLTVLLAMVPAAAMGVTLLNRQNAPLEGTALT